MSSWGGRESQNLTALVKAEYGYVCHLCMKGIATDDEYSVDHVIPRSKPNSTNALENLKPAHRSCNYSRGNRSIEEYRASHTDNTAWFMGLAA